MAYTPMSGIMQNYYANESAALKAKLKAKLKAALKAEKFAYDIRIKADELNLESVPPIMRPSVLAAKVAYESNKRNGITHKDIVKSELQKIQEEDITMKEKEKEIKLENRQLNLVVNGEMPSGKEIVDRINLYVNGGATIKEFESACKIMARL